MKLTDEQKKYQRKIRFQKAFFVFGVLMFFSLAAYAVYVGNCEYELFELETYSPCDNVQCTLERAEMSNACRFIGPKADLSALRSRVEFDKNIQDWISHDVQ